MRAKDLKWSKTRAQCPYCHNWYTKQGILGHIRFRHPDSKREETDTFEDIFKAGFLDSCGKAVEVMKQHGRLTPEWREVLFDLMLLDYLRGLCARNK